ncbi:MAG: YdiU family protein [Cyanobacteria bacterium P01_H01_bin.74]
MSKNDPSSAENTGLLLQNTYQEKLADCLYSHQLPATFLRPELLQFNEKLALQLGLNLDYFKTEAGIQFLSGQDRSPSVKPIAQAYAGHQFGHFTILGDGRAIILGEQKTPSGSLLDIQLKGAGQTPYSRQGDGRATLSSMLREYLISEAMAGLKIPTTRSLAVLSTGEPVYREQEHPGAILVRVAESHIRVGTFQYAAYMAVNKDSDSSYNGIVKQLADYAIARHYPELNNYDADSRYQEFFKAVIKRQAFLIANWQRVGFIHGVMNTDNMTISGETIDYGPCAFMDTYDPNTVFSSIDHQGRYRFSNQPVIAQWNIARLAECLMPLFNNSPHEKSDKAMAVAEKIVAEFKSCYKINWLEQMGAKLGIHKPEDPDNTLITNFLMLMQVHQADFTQTFRILSSYMTSPLADNIENNHATYLTAQTKALFLSDGFAQWQKTWQNRLALDPNFTVQDAIALMLDNNPAVIPRNHEVENALQQASESNDFTKFKAMLRVLETPYQDPGEEDNYLTASFPEGLPAYVTYCGT